MFTFLQCFFLGELQYQLRIDFKFLVQFLGHSHRNRATTIRLFSDILKGVERNPKGDGKKKGGLKVHMLIDAVQQVGRFIKMTEAKVHDKNFLKSLDLESNCMLIFDKAYNHYYQFAQWTAKSVFFATRQKSNAIYTVIKQPHQVLAN